MRGDIQDVKHEIALLMSSAAFLGVLAAVDLEKGVSAATPGPAAVFEGEKANISGVGYPICEVIGHQTNYDTNDQQVKSATHEIEITWTQVGDDELTITAQLERLVHATRDLFWPIGGADGITGVWSDPVVIVTEQYTALMPAAQHPFVKGSTTLMHVTTHTV